MEKKLVTRGLLLVNFLPFFIFPPTQVLDIDTWRLLLFSVINTLSLSYIFLVPDLTNIFNDIVKSKISLAIFAFITWGLISYFYAINGNEVILRSFTFVNFYISFLSLYVFIAFNRFKTMVISLFILVAVSCEMILSYSAYIEISQAVQYTFEFNNFLNGNFPNRNITSAIYLIQLPFVLHVLKNTESKILQIATSIIAFMLVYMIFMLGSRTAYVILICMFLAYLIVSIVSKDKKIKSYFLTFVLLVSSSFILSTFTLGTKSDAYAVNRIQTIDFNETSTNTRLRYYKYGIEQTINNPLIGVGLGNWKIVSIERDKENIISYIVPYTMHNDFLEVAAELGIIGLLIFLSIFYFGLRNSWEIYSRNKQDPTFLILPFSLLIYIIDSNFNFPFTRMSQLFYFALFLALSVYLNNKSNEDTA
ncbi:O-antigen ligase family protein [Flavobacteriaceae bacterium]|nr:O-antigen ligase family protein [Flavobacteriaceae bacterium]